MPVKVIQGYQRRGSDVCTNARGGVGWAVDVEDNVDSGVIRLDISIQRLASGDAIITGP